jgi:hypothetical protein
VRVGAPGGWRTVAPREDRNARERREKTEQNCEPDAVDARFYGAVRLTD